MSVEAPITLRADGHEVVLTHPGKVLYPATGTTKRDVLEYLLAIAPTMVPHLAGRCITLRRFPDGVDHGGFFEKHCPDHRPPWIATARGPGGDDGVDHCVLDTTAALLWSGQLAALELHAPMARSTDVENPLALVLDLDPGSPADQTDAAWVALRARELLVRLGLVGFPKLSGGKGLHVYVPLNCGPHTVGGGDPHTYQHTGEVALAIAQRLEQLHPDRVVRTMRKDRRGGKVLVDWSQNRASKTTVAPYSLRARERPTVAAPITWDEVEVIAAGASMALESAEVLERVERHGDLFAPVLDLVQRLPAPRP